MAEFTPIEKIPVDFDSTKVKGVFNPLKEQFTCLFAGKVIALESGEQKILPEHVANHVAKHLADKICRDRQTELLQEKFTGLDDMGREKWRVNEQHLVTRADIKSVKDALLFDVVVGAVPEVKEPETKFDPLIKSEKARKKAKKKDESKDVSEE